MCDPGKVCVTPVLLGGSADSRPEAVWDSRADHGDRIAWQASADLGSQPAGVLCLCAVLQVPLILAKEEATGMGPCCVDREAVAWKGSAIGPEWGQELAQVGWGPGHPSHSWTGLLRAGNSEGVVRLGGGGVVFYRFTNRRVNRRPVFCSLPLWAPCGGQIHRRCKLRLAHLRNQRELCACLTPRAFAGYTEGWTWKDLACGGGRRPGREDGGAQERQEGGEPHVRDEFTPRGSPASLGSEGAPEHAQRDRQWGLVTRGT